MSTSTPLWVPIAVAAIGVAGAITAAWLTQRASTRREDERWRRERDVDEIRWQREKAERLRELRVTLYVDLAEYIQRREASLEVVTDDVGVTKVKGPDDLVHPQRLTARVKLLAPASVIAGWAAFEAAEDRMLWELYEGSPNYTPNGEPYFDPDDAIVADVRRTISEIQLALRTAMNNLDIQD
jgi:hypothetical protein